MTWSPPSNSYGEINSAPSWCQREAKKASVADLPEITWLGGTSAQNENKESNSGWKSSFNSWDECDFRRDVFSIPLSQIFVLFLCVFTNSSRGVKTLGLEPSESKSIFPPRRVLLHVRNWLWPELQTFIGTVWFKELRAFILFHPKQAFAVLVVILSKSLCLYLCGSFTALGQ